MWKNFEDQIKNCRFDFTEEQLRNLKVSCTELYRILKYVFDAPRKFQRPYTSVDRYKYEKERVYQSPSDYYHYRDNEIQIELRKRRAIYSIAVFGNFIPEGLNFDAFIGHEKEFSGGFMYYGRWPCSQFYTSVYTYNYVVRQYINNKMNNEALF